MSIHLVDQISLIVPFTNGQERIGGFRRKVIMTVALVMEIDVITALFIDNERYWRELHPTLSEALAAVADHQGPWFIFDAKSQLASSLENVK